MKVDNKSPIPMAAQSKAWVYVCLLAGVAGSNPAGAWISVSYEFYVLSGRGPCDGSIPRPGET
jgi:hypothetical protein